MAEDRAWLDQPYTEERKDGPPWQVTLPARFSEMTPVERWTWPDRITGPWRRRRLKQVGVAGAGVLALAVALNWPVGTFLGLLGLVLDVIGVYILAEGVILSDEDATFRTTGGHMTWAHLLAMRDSRQARLGLRIAVAGFLVQGSSLVVQMYLPALTARLGLF